MSTINRILARNGLISKQASLAAAPVRRFEKLQPNDMWQGGLQGPLHHGRQAVVPPAEHHRRPQRFNLCCQAQYTETFEELQTVLIRLFREYSLPFSFLCDNGNPWGTVQSTGFTRFEVWLMELGILTLHGRARHSQTQGKKESFNRSMIKELLANARVAALADAQRQFDAYREFYNKERPHHALNLDNSSQHYRPSQRPYPERTCSRGGNMCKPCPDTMCKPCGA